MVSKELNPVEYIFTWKSKGGGGGGGCQLFLFAFQNWVPELGKMGGGWGRGGAGGRGEYLYKTELVLQMFKMEEYETGKATVNLHSYC